MLKDTQTHKHHIFTGIFTFLIILAIIVLPILSLPNNQQYQEKTPNQFINLVNSNSSITSSSNITNSSSVILSSQVLSSISSILEIPKPQLKVIEEVKPVFTQPIAPALVEKIQPQANIELIPKPIVKETPKPIIQTVVEPKPAPKPVVAPAPIVETPKIVVDNSYIASGCDQNLASQMLDIVNNHRAANGAKKLLLVNQLDGIACAHSKWMTSSGIFSHTGRDGTSPFERCKKAGTYCYAENVAYNTIPNVQDLFEQFKNSAGHNLNMLDPNFVEIGIAFDGIYVTQAFR